MGMLLQPRNQTAVLSVEKLILSTSEEIKTGQVEHQEHVSDVFCCKVSV
jgi:hypothetical protein